MSKLEDICKRADAFEKAKYFEVFFEKHLSQSPTVLKRTREFVIYVHFFIIPSYLETKRV